MNYIFIPFLNTEHNEKLVSMANEWKEAMDRETRLEKKVNIILFENYTANPLSGIKSDDVVYIISHGDNITFDKFIYSDENYLLSPCDLADRLVVAGLNKGHKKIKLYICNSNDVVSEFAVDFKGKMREKGFAEVDVYYYRASVSVPKEFSDGLFHKDGMIFSGETLLKTPRFRASNVRHRVP
ncbi:hypothetical protein I5495_05730 [Citrobacter amalonaticus]|uniref:hypothetical protein n=1 Tax=Citrobacter amalonaticus TaxID=35703 RepID=UPI001908E62D|nr:hypothetical protein [Citrobacter amalonaticus]MBJ9256836.1 hypothetical protein [Citrobacter amalonaticus]